MIKSTLCTRINCIILFLVSSIVTTAQWREISKDLANSVRGMSFLNESTGFVAFSKYVGFTTDSGRTFIKRYVTYANTDFNGYYNVNLTFGFNPSGVKAFSHDSLFIFGDYGTEPSILFSGNQGQSWVLVYHKGINIDAHSLSEGITDLEFPGNSQYGYAVHHEQILKTNDRGQTWYSVLNASDQELRKLSFPTVNTGYAIGANKIYKTSNSGASWSIVKSPDEFSTAPVYDNIFFRNELLGYVTQSFGDKIFKTTDGGTSWKKMNDETLIPIDGTDMYFINDSTGFVTSPYAYEVIKTSDNGTTWEVCKKNTNYQYLYYGLNAITFLNNKNIGWAGGLGGYLMITTDGGLQTLPGAYFKVDTANEWTTGKVNLLNYSRKIYQYKWIVNGKLISVSYNASYNHNPYKEADTIQLIVSNGSDADTSQKIAYFNALTPPLIDTGWVVKPTKINDDLSDVRFFGYKGLVIGKKGLYYTLTGADDSNGWKKFTIKSSKNDSLLLERTRFTSLAFPDKSPVFYACGNDTINNSAVIIQINLDDLSYSFRYKGSHGTNLNSIAYVPSEYWFFQGYMTAVGNKGLKVIYNIDDNTVSQIYQSDKANLIAIFNRRDYTNGNIVGMLSASTLYAGDNKGNTSYTIALGTNAVNGANVGGSNTDVIISKNTLHYYLTNQHYYFHDSITKMKQRGLTYNCVSRAGDPANGAIFIGTDSGIYRAIGYIADQPLKGNEVIEYQPSSLHKQINKIWFKQQPGYDTGYAVGKNGTLLKTVKFGGADVPYCGITSTGNCLGDNTYLTGFRGSGTNCAWYLDEKFLQNNCNGFNTIISNPGSHILKYVVSNEYGLSDTSFSTIYINPPPATDLPFQVSDTILCKSESVLISISNSQSGFKYELIQEATGRPFGYVIGTSGQIYLKTSPISEAGTYFIRVSSTNSSCTRNFLQKIHITVENTKSKFVTDKINIIKGEAVNFFNQSWEAQSYAWTFDQDASTHISSDANPQNITYTNPGQKTLTLISTSVNGCKDTLKTTAVLVYNKPSPDDICFAYNLLDTNLSRDASTIHDMASTPDGGYIITGDGTTPTVKSRYGISPYLNNRPNAILAKYTTNGALQWVVYNDNGGNFNSCTVDNNGNIYLTGGCSSNTFVHLSNGDSIKIGSDPNKYYDIGFIIKLDPSGKMLWYATIDDPSPLWQGYPVRGGIGTHIIVRNNTILVAGNFLANLSYTINGVTTQLFALKNSIYATDNQNNFIFKLKDDGALLWSAYFTNNATNELHDITGLGFDKSGNAYISGYYEDAVTIFDYKQTHTLVLKGLYARESSYVLKFDTNGYLKWNTVIVNNLGFDEVRINKMVTDALGNCYVTGGSSILNSSQYLQITSSNGYISKLSVSGYFLMKFNPEGIYKWGTGSMYAFYRGGLALYLNDDNLLSAGTIYNNDRKDSTFTLTSTSGKGATFSIQEAEFFVAQYDTSGVLIRVAKSGANPGGHVEPSNIISANNTDFIFAGNTDNYNGGEGSFNIFNNRLKVAASMDNFIVKTNYDFCNASIILLPATLLSFNGFLNNNNANLLWKVTEEINVSHYNIQRSYNGTDFSTVGIQSAAQNNTAIGKTYRYTDPLHSIPASTQVIYYRLEIVDKDGQKKYSNIIHFPVNTFPLLISPNPGDGNFSMTIKGKKFENEFYINIFDYTGRKIFSKKTLMQGNYYEEKFSLKVVSGTYLIEVSDGTQKVVQKLIVR